MCMCIILNILTNVNKVEFSFANVSYFTGIITVCVYIHALLVWGYMHYVLIYKK